MARIKRRFTHQDDTEPTSCTPPQTKSSRRKIPQERLPLSYASPDAFQVQGSAGKSCERHMGVSKAAAEIVLCEERRVLPTQALLGSQSGQRKHTEKPHHALITHEVHSNGDNYSNLGSDRADCTYTFRIELHDAEMRDFVGVNADANGVYSINILPENIHEEPPRQKEPPNAQNRRGFSVLRALCFGCDSSRDATGTTAIPPSQ